jgi:hypothetical protein
MRVSTWLLFALAFIAGCKQQLGERCHLHSDCADGLACVLLKKDDTCIVGGICQAEQPDQHRCSAKSDCVSGLVCARSNQCTEQGSSVCTSPDGAISTDGAAMSTD